MRLLPRLGVVGGEYTWLEWHSFHEPDPHMARFHLSPSSAAIYPRSLRRAFRHRCYARHQNANYTRARSSVSPSARECDGGIERVARFGQHVETREGKRARLEWEGEHGVVMFDGGEIQTTRFELGVNHHWPKPSIAWNQSR